MHFSACFKLIVLFLFKVIILVKNNNIEFIDEPVDTYGLENQQVALRCSVRGATDVKINWIRDIKNVSVYATTEKHTLDTTISIINFQLSKSNEDNYFCVAFDSSTRIFSRKSVVRIAFLNKHFVLEPQSKFSNLGETVLLECIPPLGLPVPHIDWIKDGVTLLSSDRLQIVDGGNLRINRVTWNDTGEYVCLAKSSAFRRESSKAFLDVRQRPYFIMSPKSQSVSAYSMLELFCRAAGYPNPMILWRREPASLSIPYHRTRLLVTGTLKFSSVEPADAGIYVCRATSVTGIVESIAYINVVAPPGLISTSPSKVDVYEGCRVELVCNAVGSPTPNIRWFQWSTKTYFIENNSIDRIYVTKSGNLVIIAARPEDTSTFECRVSSSAGLARSLTFVNVKFNTELIPGRIGSVSNFNIEKIVTNTSKSLRIICGISKDPEFNFSFSEASQSIFNNFHIIWLKNGKIMSEIGSLNSRIVVESDGCLFFYTVLATDEGNYTCSVYRTLSRRFAQFHFYLSVRQNLSYVYPQSLYSVGDLPSPPSNVEVVNIGDTWVLVRWLNSLFNKQSNFRVYYIPIVNQPHLIHSLHAKESRRKSLFNWNTNENFSSDRISFKLDNWNMGFENTHKTQARITGLMPNTGYWIEVRSVNHNGMSFGSLIPHIIYTRKKPFLVQFPVYDNRTVHSGSTSNLADSLYLGGQSAVDFHHLVTSLQSIEFYSIILRSVTPTEIMISWDTRSSNDVLKRIDGFRINVKPAPMSRCLATVTSNAQKQSSVVSNTYSSLVESEDLYKQNSIFYMSTESVYCSFESSRLLEQVIFMTNTGNVLSSEFTRNTFSKNTSTPTSIIVLTSYTLSRDKSTEVTVIGNLSPFTCYEVNIEAFRDDLTYGRVWSRSSRAELVLTLDSEPDVSPKLITAEWLIETSSLSSKTFLDSFNLTSKTSNGIRLAWMPLDLNSAHGAILGYVIHLITNSSKLSRVIHVSYDVLNKEIHGLNPLMEYIVYVSAVTCRGEGVRGPGFRLLPIASSSSLHDKSNVDFSDKNLQNYLLFPQWAYLSLCALIVFWILFGLCVYYFVHHSSRKISTNSSKTTHYNIPLTKFWSLFRCFKQPSTVQTSNMSTSALSNTNFYHYKSKSTHSDNDKFELAHLLQSKHQIVNSNQIDLNQIRYNGGTAPSMHLKQDLIYTDTNAMNNNNNNNMACDQSHTNTGSNDLKSSDLTFDSNINNHCTNLEQHPCLPSMDAYSKNGHELFSNSNDGSTNHNASSGLSILFTNPSFNREHFDECHYNEPSNPTQPNLHYNVIGNEQVFVGDRDNGVDERKLKLPNSINVPFPRPNFANRSSSFRNPCDDDTVSAYASCSVFDSNQLDIETSVRDQLTCNMAITLDNPRLYSAMLATHLNKNSVQTNNMGAVLSSASLSNSSTDCWFAVRQPKCGPMDCNELPIPIPDNGNLDVDEHGKSLRLGLGIPPPPKYPPPPLPRPFNVNDDDDDDDFVSNCRNNLSDGRTMIDHLSDLAYSSTRAYASLIHTSPCTNSKAMLTNVPVANDVCIETTRRPLLDCDNDDNAKRDFNVNMIHPFANANAIINYPVSPPPPICSTNFVLSNGSTDGSYPAAPLMRHNQWTNIMDSSGLNVKNYCNADIDNVYDANNANTNRQCFLLNNCTNGSNSSHSSVSQQQMKQPLLNQSLLKNNLRPIPSIHSPLPQSTNSNANTTFYRDASSRSCHLEMPLDLTKFEKDEVNYSDIYSNLATNSCGNTNVLCASSPPPLTMDNDTKIPTKQSMLSQLKVRK